VQQAKLTLHRGPKEFPLSKFLVSGDRHQFPLGPSTVCQWNKSEVRDADQLGVYGVSAVRLHSFVSDAVGLMEPGRYQIKTQRFYPHLQNSVDDQAKQFAVVVIFLHVSQSVGIGSQQESNKKQQGTRMLEVSSFPTRWKVCTSQMWTLPQ